MIVIWGATGKWAWVPFALFALQLFVPGAIEDLPALLSIMGHMLRGLGFLGLGVASAAVGCQVSLRHL